MKVNKANHTIHWILIYPVNSVIHLLNNPGLVNIKLGVTLKKTSISLKGEYIYSYKIYATETGDMYWFNGLLGSYADYLDREVLHSLFQEFSKLWRNEENSARIKKARREEVLSLPLAALFSLSRALFSALRPN